MLMVSQKQDFQSPQAMTTSTNTAFIHADQVGLSFPSVPDVLENVNFDIPRGQFVSILGASGCGKSSLLRVMSGLQTATAGLMLLDGRSTGNARENNLRSAFVFQDPTLLPWRTVRSNVSLPFELRDSPESEYLEHVKETINLVGLTEADAGKRPRELSGGMRMRASLARALVTNPDLMLMDEPFAPLDDILRQQLNEEILRIWSDQKWTAVFVTHNVSEAVFLSQRILVMHPRPGRIAADIEVPFDYPRTAKLRATAEFAELMGTVSQELRRTVE
ncbi:MAG: ABC transporter ATP-binding protein [Planctomycetaceae bacterium]|jgi:NitT/TauT family transport system ATP-binding protein|nr:ABC transporter ATP-binding protein [Planctomycetaceae bacterium]